jgi:hypothetical protein
MMAHRIVGIAAAAVLFVLGMALPSSAQSPDITTRRA